MQHQSTIALLPDHIVVAAEEQTCTDTLCFLFFLFLFIDDKKLIFLKIHVEEPILWNVGAIELDKCISLYIMQWINGAAANRLTHILGPLMKLAQRLILFAKAKTIIGEAPYMYFFFAWHNAF